MVVAAYGVYLSLNVGSRPARVTASAPNEGITSGFLLHVVSVHRDVSDGDLAVPASRHLVKVGVTFENTSGSQQRADAADLRLRSLPGGSSESPIFASTGDCRHWQRADLYPPKGDGGPLRDADARRSGPNFGPVTLCFSLGSADGPLFLVWSPDVGLLDSTVSIPLRGR